MTKQLEHLVVIGTGLIGGSVARALRRSGFVRRITGVGRSTANLEKARTLGVIDAFATDIGTAVTDTDMVLVAVPMGAYDAVFSQLATHLPARVLITDAGSTKQHAIAAARRHLDGDAARRFVPAHPIAGTEKSGVEASVADLFDGRLCIITPDEATDADALEKVQAMWEATGSRVITMPAGEHDDFLAAVSHLPHLAAYALVNAVRKLGDATHDPFRFAAGGFRDFTRIASSSPEMWRDIALCNREALMHKIDALQAELALLKQALADGDADTLLDAFAAAKQARDAWLATHGDNL
ncbi:MAG: prephenate dehydrogenase/arogenate dehydrogenase family protein [Mariprofundaceae bacterium]|nr:prephenate dehydrogenase/arogenate dehydrogenase family protein [Mariprofundaceae bacterium]